jgi:hypothetical protein
MAEWNVTLFDGAPATVVEYAASQLAMICSAAYLPGKPITLRGQCEGTELALHGKSAGSKLRTDGRYDVKLRLVSLRRGDRERLQALFSAAQP